MRWPYQSAKALSASIMFLIRQRELSQCHPEMMLSTTLRNHGDLLPLLCVDMEKKKFFFSRASDTLQLKTAI